MEIIFFVIGTTIFVALGFFITFWTMSRFPEKHFYLILLCFYLMASINNIFFLFGENVFGQEVYALLKVIVPIAFMVFASLYVFMYVIHAHNKFDSRLLFLTPLYILQFSQIFFSKNDLIDSIRKINLSDKISFLLCVLILITVTTSMLQSKHYREIDKEKRLYKMYALPKSTDIPMGIYIDYLDKSSKINESLNDVIFKLYHIRNKHRISKRALEKFLQEESDLPSFFNKRIMDRFNESYALSRVGTMGILNFAYLIFPEFYASYYQRSSSDVYESRFFEEYYSLFRKNANATYQLYEQISEKVDQIINQQAKKQIGNENNSDDKRRSISYEYAETVVREINHCIKTPLITIKLAIGNLLKESKDITETQQKKLNTINGNILMIESIINGYRKLVTLSEDPLPDKIAPYITTAISALNDQLSKKVKLNISDFVEPQIVHGNNIIIIMLLPLVHNAFEASPNEDTVVVSCVEKDGIYTISVENNCSNPIDKQKLKTDGFTTKEKGGEGLRSVRRIASALGINFTISAYNKGTKVIANLIIPKTKEDDDSNE